MTLDLFAGFPVSDLDAALAWYERLLGTEPAFFPNDVEAVWELGEHCYLYVEVRADHAGHARSTVFVDDYDARVADAERRGIEPAERETYANGVRHATYRDPDGNELCFGGPPVEPEGSTAQTR
jgi:catechol 2,3-dioxygenase-like lactoylglutathione lyase family enzyme